MTRTEARANAHYHQMAERLRKLEVALHQPNAAQGVLPEAWTAIAQGATTTRKERVTLWVEADVLKFFRALGPLYSTRMAEVLSTFMHARLAGVVKGPEEVNYRRFILPTPAMTKAEGDRAADELERLVAEIEAEMKRKGRGEGGGAGRQRAGKATVLWTVARPDCPGGREAGGQGVISVSGRLDIGARLPGRARVNAPAGGRQARPDLSRDKSAGLLLLEC